MPRKISTTIERDRIQGPFEDPLNLAPGESFITKGILLRNRRRIVLFGVVVLLVCSLLSYFVKPHPPVGELVSPQQELPGFEYDRIEYNDLAQRVSESYNLAFVLFGSPYTADNVRALENVRTWAQEKYRSSPDFLHPVRIKPDPEPNDTVFGALGYNLFAQVRYAMEGLVRNFLSMRIADFHQEPAYKSFAASFFEIYGKDAEAATLLAKYQSDKAKEAVPVILWALAWGSLISFAALLVGFAPRRQRFDRIRIGLVLTWAFISLCCGASAWMDNSIQALLSSLMAAAIGIYFLKPFVLLTRQDSSLKVYFIKLSSRWIALSAWASYSLLAITILTWIRATLPEHADPVSLLLSGFSGNFLSDPDEGKKTVARLLGMGWLLVSLWAFMQRNKDASIIDQLEEELAAL